MFRITYFLKGDTSPKVIEAETTDPVNEILKKPGFESVQITAVNEKKYRAVVYELNGSALNGAIHRCSSVYSDPFNAVGSLFNIVANEKK